jgi:predicted PurR-regulated permease PerM
VALGFLVGLGWFLAQVLGDLLVSISSVLILVVVAFFLAAGLDPSVRWLTRRGLRRPYAVLAVIVGVIVALVLFVVALVPVISDQISSIVDNAPGWLAKLEGNQQVQDLDDRFGFIEKAQAFITDGKFAGSVFGGVLGATVAVLGFLGNAFIVIVLTLYFLASLEHTKNSLYELAPATKRDRVRDLGDRMLESIGGYVSGAVVVAACAGISSLIFLEVVGLNDYAIALAAVVTLLDIIPMIGATIGAVIVSAIALATDVKTGIACVIFYVIYQQVENYVIYPRVMARSVNVPGAVTVIAALTGAALLGVVGALLAIPTAAALLLLVREVWVPRQEAR